MTVPRKDWENLVSMHSYAQRVQQYTRDLNHSRAHFDASPPYRDAIIRGLSVVGEAARRISPTTKTAHPQIPWDQIKGMRNQLIHNYNHIHLGTVWKTATKSIPELIDLLEPLIASEPDRTPDD